MDLEKTQITITVRSDDGFPIDSSQGFFQAGQPAPISISGGITTTNKKISSITNAAFSFIIPTDHIIKKNSDLIILRFPSNPVEIIVILYFLLV